jgi:septation ring formation regulator EzrA
MDTFEVFKSKVAPEVEDVRELMRHKIPKQGEEIFDVMREVEGWNDRLQEILAEAEQQLDEAEAAATKIIYKDYKEYSADLKKILVAAQVSNVRVFRDIVQGKIQSTQDRVRVCQSLLAYVRDLKT